MVIAVGDLGVANTETLGLATLERGWTIFAHTQPCEAGLAEAADDGAVSAVWESLGVLHRHQISHGDLRSSEITVDAGRAAFGGFGNSEYGATDEQLQADVAQLLATTADRFGAQDAVRAAIEVLGTDKVLDASRRLTRTAVPPRILKA